MGGAQDFIAGYLAADGCISDTGKGQKRLFFGAAEQDKDTIEYIKRELNYSGSLLIRKSKSFISPTTKKISHYQDHYYCRISSNTLCADLEKRYKIGPRKSLTLEYPDLKTDEEHINFISGVFIGDGYASTVKNERKKNSYYTRFNICSASKIYIKEISKQVLRLINYVGTNEYIQTKKLKGYNNIYYFCLSGKNAEDWIRLMLETGFNKVPERKWKKISIIENLDLIRHNMCWVKKEIKIIEDNYKNLGPVKIQELLPNRTYNSIIYKAGELDLTIQYPWIKKEIKIIEDNYKNLGPIKIQNLLPGRTYSSITQKASKLGLTK